MFADIITNNIFRSGNLMNLKAKEVGYVTDLAVGSRLGSAILFFIEGI